jgi:2-oxoglutarate dehydrogenase E1 component
VALFSRRRLPAADRTRLDLRPGDAVLVSTELADGRFQPVLDDPAVPDRSAVTRLVLTSGKVYYDIAANERRAQASNIAVARFEQLYPFPVDAAAALVASYPSVRDVVWAQEEPQNMGAWRAIRHRLEEAVAGKPLRYVGRPWRASPSEGYPTSHQRAQQRIVEDVLEVAPS